MDGSTFFVLVNLSEPRKGECRKSPKSRLDKKQTEMTEIKFEAGKIYEVSFPDGSALIVKLIGGEPPMYQVKDGSIIGYERLDGFSSIKEIADELEDTKGGVK